MENEATEVFPAGAPEPQIEERVIGGRAGLPMLITALAVTLGGAALLAASIARATRTPDDEIGSALMIAGSSLLILLGVAVARGLIAVSPGDTWVVQFLGRYVGTVRRHGLAWVNPLTTRRRVSARIRNHETAVMKVNDGDGNPIEIAAVVVWQVRDTARALFDVDDFVEFIRIQTETAVRHIANGYPYDAHHEDQLSLRDNADEITKKLSAEVGVRGRAAGIHVIESRITHLAYAPEIAHAMLRRQQANAVVAARQRIVEGAVGMVELALDRLAERDIVDLDEERKAAMVSNLLVVLCGDRDTQPVINTGSLYH